MTDLWTLDATAMAEAVRRKQVSAAELAKAALDRVAALDTKLHAFCTPTPEIARAEAASVDRAIASGAPTGPLAGVPYGIKDLICTKDVRTMSGAVAFADFVPDEDDVVVERMRDAGAVSLGKTNVPEFGYSGVGHNPVCETTRNPWDLERTPGRSSWESLEHIGPMTRTVRDAALMLSVIVGPDDRARRTIPCGDIDWIEAAKPRDLKGLRVAYSPDWGYAAVDPEVRRVVGEAMRVFERDLGCIVEEARPGWEDPYNAFWGVVAAESDLNGLREIAAKPWADGWPAMAKGAA